MGAFPRKVGAEVDLQLEWRALGREVDPVVDAVLHLGDVLVEDHERVDLLLALEGVLREARPGHLGGEEAAPAHGRRVVHAGGRGEGRFSLAIST